MKHILIQILFGTKFKSVTGFIKLFEAPVDWEVKRRNSAIKQIKKEKGNAYKPSEDEINAVSAELKEKWSYAGTYATTLGTEIHSVLENLWYRKDYAGNKSLMSQYDGMYQDFLERKTYCKSLYNKLKNVYVPIKNELIVYDVDNELCGTIDFLAYNKKTDSYAILDWKTSKELNTFDQYNNSKMVAPFDIYDDCNVNHYSLQLSTYAWMLEKHTSIKISELILFQIPKITTQPVIARCNDMRPILNKILK